MKNKMEMLAKEIYDFCVENDLWGDNIIYFNRKAWSSSSKWGGVDGKKIGNDLYEYEDKDPRDYFEYANPDTISMSFEGPLNHALNGYVRNWNKIFKEFTKLFVKYDLYWEFGYSWSLSAYEL